MKYKTLCRGMLAIVMSAALVSNGNVLGTGMQGKTIIKAESSNDTPKIHLILPYHLQEN